MPDQCIRTPAGAVCRHRFVLALCSIAVMVLTAALHAGADQPAARNAPPAEALRNRLKGATTPAARRSASIRLAEHLLNVDCAAALTSELMGDGSERPAIRAAANEALQVLDAAPKPGSSSTRPVGDEERVALLRAFGGTFEAIASMDDSDASRRALMSACIELAIYTDDPDPQIAAAAELWQAAAYRRAGRADRTLQMTWPPLSRNAGTFVDLYARLERSRALGDAGQYVAAIALATKIEGKIDEWLIDQPREVRRAAKSSARRTRADLYRQWCAVLEKQGHNDRAADAKREAEAIDKKLEQRDSGMLRLDVSIAILPELDASPRE